MKIALVTRTDTDMTLDLAHVLCEIGHSVTVYLSKTALLDAGAAPELYIAALYQKGIIPPCCQVFVCEWPRIRDPRSYLTARRIRQDMRARGIEVAHLLIGPSEPWLAVLANLIQDIAVVSTMIVPIANLWESHQEWETLFNRVLVRGSDMVIVNGENLVEMVAREYKIPAGRIVSVPLGARTTAFKMLRRPIEEQPGTILFFGRSNRHKGLEYLVRAQPLISAQVPHARILIASNGPELTRCRAMIQDENAFEIFDGYVPGEAMADYYSRAALVALPYLSASSSGVLSTACIFGKPVVSTDVGCLAEYVREGVTGLLVPPADVEQLARAVIRLLKDDALRRQMGENARKWVEEEYIANGQRTAAVYAQAIKYHAGRSRMN